MRGRRLFLLVEGNDDQRFFSRVIRPLMLQHYASVDIILYASMKSAKVCRYLKGLESMHYDFILVADIDQEPTVHQKKQVLMSRFSNLSPDHVMVIVKEIESWYLAGLDDAASSGVGMRRLKSTDFLTKEHFNRWMPLRYGSRIAFMIACLQRFSIPVAMEKNRSFNYFMHHYRLAEDASGLGGTKAASEVSDTGGTEDSLKGKDEDTQGRGDHHAAYPSGYGGTTEVEERERGI